MDIIPIDIISSLLAQFFVFGIPTIIIVVIIFYIIKSIKQYHLRKLEIEKFKAETERIKTEIEKDKANWENRENFQ